MVSLLLYKHFYPIDLSRNNRLTTKQWIEVKAGVDRKQKECINSSTPALIRMYCFVISWMMEMSIQTGLKPSTTWLHYLHNFHLTTSCKYITLVISKKQESFYCPTEMRNRPRGSYLMSNITSNNSNNSLCVKSL